MTKAWTKCRRHVPDGVKFCWLHKNDDKKDSVKERKSTFAEDIWKIVIDKLLIAVIVLLASTYATNVIEILKNDRSLKSQIDVLRAGKIAETWESVYALEDNYAVSRIDATDRFRQEKKILEFEEREIHRKFPDSEILDEKSAEEAKKELESYQQKVSKATQAINAIQIKFEEAYRTTKAIVAKNRFWLGDNYSDTLRQYIELFVSNPPASANDDEVKKFNNSLQQKIAAKRLSIIHLRDELLSH